MVCSYVCLPEDKGGIYRKMGELFADMENLDIQAERRNTADAFCLCGSGLCRKA